MKNPASQYGIFVSIAMPTFNSEKYIRQQVDSLLNQTYRNFELVISDDLSKDTTPQILDKYVKHDSRVRWSSNPHPNGCAGNFERVMGHCKGEIIFLCDSDDTWDPKKLELHMNEYRKDKKVAWVYNRSVLTDIHNNPIGYIEDSSPNYYTKRTLLENTWGSCIGGAHMSFRAKYMNRVLPFDKAAGAHDPWIQVVLYPRKAVFIDKVLQTYRQHGNNDTGWSKEPIKISDEEYKKKEGVAIANNLARLKTYSKNKQFELWKRILFFMLYRLKIIRRTIKSN